MSLYNPGQEVCTPDSKSDSAEKIFNALCQEDRLLAPEAQFKLGVCYEYGIGTQPSLIDAVKWYRAAGANGFEGGQRKLEHFSKYGFGNLVSVRGATDWSLVYARLIEDYEPGEEQTEFQVMPTRYV